MKIIKSFSFAWTGLKICFTSETNFKIHVLAAVVAVLLGAGLNISAGEWLIIVLCIAFVTAMEMINTALEKLCDVVNENIHPEIKAIKDIAAGAVLISAVCSLIIGLIVFIPKIIMYLKSF